SPRRLATRIFSEAWDQPLRAIRGPRSPSPLGVSGRTDLPIRPTYELGPGHPTPGRPTLLRPPFAQTSSRRCRNINLLSIAYAFRPRLRNRLTLSRLPLPRKPQTSGEWVSHPFYRYSCLHNHFQGLQQSLPVCLRRRLECSPTAPLLPKRGS